ncbi:MAG: hypothetical protein ABI839_05200 [Verrucomicrobiota bacterium]
MTSLSYLLLPNPIQFLSEFGELFVDVSAHRNVRGRIEDLGAGLRLESDGSESNIVGARGTDFSSGYNHISNQQQIPVGRVLSKADSDGHGRSDNLDPEIGAQIYRLSHRGDDGSWFRGADARRPSGEKTWRRGVSARDGTSAFHRHFELLRD